MSLPYVFETLGSEGSSLMLSIQADEQLESGETCRPRPGITSKNRVRRSFEDGAGIMRYCTASNASASAGERCSKIGMRFQPCSAIPHRVAHSWYLTEDVCQIQWNLNQAYKKKFQQDVLQHSQKVQLWSWSSYPGEQCCHIHSSNAKSYYQHFLFRLLYIAPSNIARKVQMLVGKAIWV